MKAEMHFLFSIFCSIFSKRAELTPVLKYGDWWHIIPSSIITCLLPDIDHPSSFIGRRIKFISKPISKLFGHRKFTHSLLATFSIFTILHFIILKINRLIIPADVFQGMIIGYVSHIIADMLTSIGVPILWPFYYKFRLPILYSNQAEYIFCLTILIWLLFFTSHSLNENIIIKILFKIIDILQNIIQFFIEH